MTRHVTWDRGVSLVGHGLWLDPLTVRDLAFVSHAHRDHARRHREAVMTEATWALLPKPLRPRAVRLIQHGDSLDLDHATDGKVVIAFTNAKAIDTTDPPPAHLQNGDVLVAVDPVHMDVFTTTIRGGGH